MARIGHLNRDVTIAECPWLKEKLMKGKIVYLDETQIVPWIRVSVQPDLGPFFGIPEDAVRWNLTTPPTSRRTAMANMRKTFNFHYGLPYNNKDTLFSYPYDRNHRDVLCRVIEHIREGDGVQIIVDFSRITSLFLDHEVNGFVESLKRRWIECFQEFDVKAEIAKVTHITKSEVVILMFTSKECVDETKQEIEEHPI